MRSCIQVFYIALFVSAGIGAAAAVAVSAAQSSPASARPGRGAPDAREQRAVSPSDPDALYRERDELRKAQQAADIWQSRVKANARDFESAWKLARAEYWLGGHVPDAERRAHLEQGVEAGRLASAIEPSRPEGYFWMAANMGALAESFGVRQGLKYRGAIKNALETVLEIDPTFQQGSADRALGRWYLKVPGLFGGSKKKSEEHLRKSLTYNPESTASHYFLAETLFAMDRDREAVEELQKVLAAPTSADWGPEDRDFKRRAKQKLTASGSK